MKLKYFVFLLLAFMRNKHVIAQIDEVAAEEKVKNAICLDGLSIEQVLIDKFHSRSQRDLGWQVFKEQDQYDVERAFLMSKSMQLRFRWHVNAEGVISPDAGRAESLCIKAE
ncbi:MAG: hypothetical protein NTY69_08655 [Methylococcales bacterium]|nr:hypothetical protein [Methylococcales bacterium]